MSWFYRVLLVVCTLQIPAHAEPRRIFDRIVAVVDHDPILLSEVHAALRRFLPILDRYTDAKEREEAYATALRDSLDHTIDKHLVQREASKKGVTVAPDEIDRALDSVVKQTGLPSLQALYDEVQKMGMTVTDYRADIAMQILEMRLVAMAGIKSESQEKFEQNRKGYLQRLRKAAYIEVRL